MNYWLIAGFLLVLWSVENENKRSRERIAELRRVMDLQFDGLRSEFSEVKKLLSWIEPQVPGILGYTSVRHTGLESTGELVKAVNDGRYAEALVPWTVLRAPVGEGYSGK